MIRNNQEYFDAIWSAYEEYRVVEDHRIYAEFIHWFNRSHLHAA